MLPGSDVGDISEDAPNDLEGLDASAAHVANLLSTEPPNSMFSIIPWEEYWCDLSIIYFFILTKVITVVFLLI